MPVLHSLAHQLSEDVPPTIMPVLHSLAPQQHLRLLQLHLMCAVLHTLCIACVLTRVVAEHLAPWWQV